MLFDVDIVFRSEAFRYYGGVQHRKAMAFQFDGETVGLAVSRIVRKARRTDKGFAALVEYCQSQCPSKQWSKLAALDAASAAEAVSARVREILTAESVGRSIGCLFFGLFEGEFSDSDQPAAGFYLAGLKSFDPEDLEALCDPPYFPADRYIRSPLLDAVLRAAHADRRAGEFIFYALLLGAGALLAKHAVRDLKKKYRLVVGFDDGDVIEV